MTAEVEFSRAYLYPDKISKQIACLPVRLGHRIGVNVLVPEPCALVPFVTESIHKWIQTSQARILHPGDRRTPDHRGGGCLVEIREELALDQ